MFGLDWWVAWNHRHFDYGLVMSDVRDIYLEVCHSREMSLFCLVLKAVVRHCIYNLNVYL